MDAKCIIEMEGKRTSILNLKVFPLNLSICVVVFLTDNDYWFMVLYLSLDGLKNIR